MTLAIGSALLALVWCGLFLVFGIALWRAKVDLRRTIEKRLAWETEQALLTAPQAREVWSTDRFARRFVREQMEQMIIPDAALERDLRQRLGLPR